MNFTNPKAGDTAFAAYDEAFERQLAKTIARAVVEASRVGDDGLIALRTAETVSALLKLVDVVENFAACGGTGGGAAP